MATHYKDRPKGDNMNTWDVVLWSLLVAIFFTALAIVLTGANWFFVMSLVVTTACITYFLGEA